MYSAPLCAHGCVGFKVRCGQAHCWCVAFLRQQKATGPRTNENLSKVNGAAFFPILKSLRAHGNVTAVDIMAHKSSKTKNFGYKRDRAEATELNSALMELGIYQENSCFTPNNLTV